jgi:hypothetical protein
VLQAGPGGQERAVEVDRQQLLPVGIGEIDQRADDLDAGVGDEDVDAAVALRRRGDAGLDLVLAGDVHRDRQRLAAGGLDLLGDGGRRLEIEVGDHRDRALGGEPPGDSPAETARRAGDDRNPSFKPCHQDVLCQCVARRLTRAPGRG